MLDVFLELEVLWLLMMFLKINNAINYILQFKTILHSWNLNLKKKKKKKKTILKIHIKASFSIVFSPMLDVLMCIKVKSCVTFKIYVKFNHKIKFKLFLNAI